MRNAFIDELVRSAQKDESIVLVVGDLGYGVVEPFEKEFPNRFFNAGVAEQNMMGLSAGLASEGFHVYVYSIANFPTFRCAEQIRNDVAYHNLPVTIVAVGGGLSYGNLGYSHHAVQDFALIRSMPNMLIASPGDPIETLACVKFLNKNPQPSYLRIGKAGEQNYHNSVINLSPGDLVKTDDIESNKVIITTGTALKVGKELQELTENKFTVMTMPLWSMQCKEQIADKISNFEEILVLEDHLIDGGFGSWVLESLSNDKELYSKVTIKALDPKVCGMVGTQETLNKEGGLDPIKILESIS